MFFTMFIFFSFKKYLQMGLVAGSNYFDFVNADTSVSNFSSLVCSLKSYLNELALVEISVNCALKYACTFSLGKSESILPRKDLNVLPSGTSELFGGNITEGRDCCYELELQQLQPPEKIKLQLFPINESTRLRLEKVR